MLAQSLTFLSLLVLSAQAIITPTSPDSTTVVKAGDKIQALWTADQASNWNNVEIQLMTGDNLQMVALATVATGIDGTTTTSYSFDAPEVEPYSKIYFLQFTNGGDLTNVTWTTRFTIASASGETTEPTNSTVYSGTAVEWGTGKLVSAVTTDAGSGSSSNSTASGVSTASIAASASAVQSEIASASASATDASASASASESASDTSAAASSATSAGRSATSASASASASAGGASSGAGKLEAGVGLAIMAGVAAYALL